MNFQMRNVSSIGSDDMVWMTLSFSFSRSLTLPSSLVSRKSNLSLMALSSLVYSFSEAAKVSSSILKSGSSPLAFKTSVTISTIVFDRWSDSDSLMSFS